jgi:hypothetical protein
MMLANRADSRLVHDGSDVKIDQHSGTSGPAPYVLSGGAVEAT